MPAIYPNMGHGTTNMPSTSIDNAYTTKIQPNLSSVEALLSTGATEEQVCAMIGVSKATWSKYLKSEPEFREVVARAMEKADAAVVGALFSRAVGFDYVEVITVSDGDGRLVETRATAKKVLPDIGACIFWLKNRNPEKWSDRVKLDHSGDVRTSIVLPREVMNSIHKDNRVEVIDVSMRKGDAGLLEGEYDPKENEP